jgi:hypothetical protein
MGAGGCGHQDPAQFFRRVPQFAAVAQVDRVALQPLHGLGDVHAAHGGHDDVLDITHGESIAGGLFPPDLVVQKITAGHPLRIDAQRPRDIPDDASTFSPISLSTCRSSPMILMPTGVLMPVESMSMTGLDGHGPGVGQAGKLDGLVQFIHQIVHGHAFAPFGFRFEQ